MHLRIRVGQPYSLAVALLRGIDIIRFVELARKQKYLSGRNVVNNL
jgi:hypothetical protein